MNLGARRTCFNLIIRYCATIQGTIQKRVEGEGEQMLAVIPQSHLHCPDEFKDKYQSQSFAKVNCYRLLVLKKI